MTVRLKPAEKVPIIVALISLVGGMFGVLVSNSDKLFGGDAHPVAVAASPTAGQAAPVTPLPAEATELATAQQRVLGGGVAALDSIAAQIEGGSRPDVGGAWHDSDGYDYVFTQDGDAYGFVQLRNGSPIGSGDGRLSGRSFRHTFRGQFGTGECSGAVSVDGQRASGTCRSGAASWGFAVNR